ncbi:MAG TPA: flagellar basal-body MS-ring/collar protein FliF [Allosphingosinicella sp.]|nr:flagellar basal-body MS-ring/collar protein FliF [Allosphingosinicella sp.]
MLQSFRSAPPSRQLLLSGLTVALLCALLAGAYFLWFRTSYSVLFSNLREADAGTIVAELERGHVDYRLRDGGRTILVPAGSVDSTRLHIAGQDLPLQGTVGFELFNSSSIGLTEFAQRINLQRALQGELTRTIMNIEGVESARVHLSLGEQSIFRGDRRPPRASVAVRTRVGRRLNPNAVRGIQRLVAGAVPELEPGNVAVLNDRGVLVSAELPAEAAAGSAEERNVERFFETRIRRAVEARYPADAVEVTVWAALAGGAAPSEQELATGRDFRLRATVAIASPLAAAARESVAQSVRDAIGFDAALGDVVTVTDTPPVPAASDWDAGLAQPDRNLNLAEDPLPQPRASSWSGSLWTPLVLLALAGAILFVLRRRAAAGGLMSEQDRLAYATQLKALLAQRDADAAPTA